MRILMVSQDFPPVIGGIQTYAYELAREFAKRCDRFAVVTARNPAAASVDRDLPFPVRRLPVPREGFSSSLVAVAGLPWLERRGGWDAFFHVQWYTLAAGLGARAAGLTRRCFVAAHGRELRLNLLGGVPGLRRVVPALRRSLLVRADGCFPVSRYTGQLLEADGVDPARVHVMPNGVDPERRRPGEGARFRAAHGLGPGPLLFTVSRLVPRKGVDTVLRALPAIAARVPDVHYAVAGDGPDRLRLETIAAAMGVSGRVTFLGRLPEAEMNDAYSAGDVFVMPVSDSPPDVEGFGLVFLEASACGRPVIGSWAGGVPDAVVDGETGYLVPPADPEAFVAAAMRLLTDPGLASRLGRAGRERVLRQGTWAHTAEAMLGRIAESL